MYNQVMKHPLSRLKMSLSKKVEEKHDLQILQAQEWSAEYR